MAFRYYVTEKNCSKTANEAEKRMLGAYRVIRTGLSDGPNPKRQVQASFIDKPDKRTLGRDQTSKIQLIDR